jgi:hypothetical protein
MMTTTLESDSGVAASPPTASRSIRHRLVALFSATGIALGVLTCGPAAAVLAGNHGEPPSRQPIAREQIDDRFVDEIDPFALDVCGVEVRVEGRIWGHVVLYSDESARRHLNIEIIWSDPETGDVLLVERDAETFFEEAPISQTVDEQAGTLTIVFEAKITGLPLKGVVPAEGVLIRDAGWITQLVTVVLDLETGEEISVADQFLDVRGPHPFAELTPAERDALFCTAISG